MFHVRFEPAIAENGFAAVDSGWAKQEAGRERKEDARERKGNKFWVRLRGEVRKDGGRRHRPWLPPSPVRREKRRRRRREEKGEGFESEGGWRSGFGVIRGERALFGLV